MRREFQVAALAMLTATLPLLSQLADAPQVGVLHVKGNVYLIYGAGTNITMQVGDQVAVLVDAGPVEWSEQIRTAIRGLTSKPIGYILQTSADANHTGGT